MPITITLPNPINVSLQAKPQNVIEGKYYDSGGWDIIYFIKIDPTTQKQIGEIQRVGICISITKGQQSYEVVIEPDATAQTPLSGDFIFFGKNNKIGTSGVRGYHSVVEMRNDSHNRAELFSVGSEITLSSK